MEKQSRTEAIIKMMRAKVTLEEEKFKLAHVFKPANRSHSQEKLTSFMTKCTLLDEPGSEEYYPFEHPLNSYKKYLSKHVVNDFQLLKIKANGNDQAFRKLKRKIQPKILLRV